MKYLFLSTCNKLLSESSKALLCLMFLHSSTSLADISVMENSLTPPNEEALFKADNLSQVGKGTYYFAFLKIYDAELLAPEGVFSKDGTFSAEDEFALRLMYARSLKGEKIVDKSIELIEAQDFDDQDILEQWRATLNTLIPDVDKGDSLTAYHYENEMLVYYNDRLIGSTQDELAIQYFFGIWLAESTSAPSLRKSLIGN